MSVNLRAIVTSFHSMSQTNLNSLSMVLEFCPTLEDITTSLNEENLDDINQGFLQIIDFTKEQCSIAKKAIHISKKLSNKYDELVSCENEINNIAEDKNLNACEQILEYYLFNYVPEYKAVCIEHNDMLAKAKDLCSTTDLPGSESYCIIVDNSDPFFII